VSPLRVPNFSRLRALDGANPMCTNICLGGEEMRDAWITASGTGQLYMARWPRPGLKLAVNL
jgi:sugar lactone lactonase YvrE